MVIVIFSGFVGSFESAFHAKMFNDIIFGCDLQIDGFHQTAAVSFSVAGIDVDMQTVKAFGTVICKTVTCDFETAVAADKVFGPFLEFSAHGFINMVR